MTDDETRGAEETGGDEEILDDVPPLDSVVFIDLASLLTAVESFLGRFVVMTPEQLTAVVLWVAHTHAFRAAEATPYLQIGSATPRAGKTRLLEALEPLVCRPWFTGRTTAAALSRKVDAGEADAVAR